MKTVKSREITGLEPQDERWSITRDTTPRSGAESRPGMFGLLYSPIVEPGTGCSDCGAWNYLRFI